MTEIELKFPVEDFARVLDAAERMGFVEVADREETNRIFERVDGEPLCESGILLRVRESRPRQGDGKLTLTLKRPLGGSVGREERGAVTMKVRQELEADIAAGDAPALTGILEALGFRECYRYSKHRIELRKERVSVCLDELDFGRFVEIESDSRDAVERTALDLGLDPAAGLAASYMELGARASASGSGVRPSETEAADDR